MKIEKQSKLSFFLAILIVWSMCFPANVTFAASETGKTIFQHDGEPLFEPQMNDDGSLFIGSYQITDDVYHSDFMTVSKDGEELDKWEAKGKGILAKTADGTPFIYTYDKNSNTLKAYSMDQELKWEEKVEGYLNELDEQGNIYFSKTVESGSGFHYINSKYTPEGAVYTFIEENSRTMRITPNGKAYQLLIKENFNEKLQKLNADGTVAWERDVFEDSYNGVDDVSIRGHILHIDESGSLYIFVHYKELGYRSLGSQIYKVDSEGEIIWNSEIGTDREYVDNWETNVTDNAIILNLDEKLFFYDKQTGKQLNTISGDRYYTANTTSNNWFFALDDMNHLKVFDKYGNPLWSYQLSYYQYIGSYKTDLENNLIAGINDSSDESSILRVFSEQGKSIKEFSFNGAYIYSVITDQSANDYYLTLVDYVSERPANIKTEIVLLSQDDEEDAGSDNDSDTPPKFSDIAKDYEYEKQIAYLSDKAIIKGFEDGTFRPTETITRLQAVNMTLNEMGIDPDTYNAPNPGFDDVKPDSYGYKSIAAAVELGFISGKPDNTFDANGHLTRGQMAAILVSAYELTGTFERDFADIPRGEWPYDVVSTLAANGITSGYEDDTFRPYNKLKREHFAVFMYNLLRDEGTGKVSQ